MDPSDKLFRIVVIGLIMVSLLLLQIGIFNIDPGFFLMGGLALFLLILSFLKTNIALTILLFSMLLSPEFGAGGAGGRAVAIRIEDFFLGVVLFGWFAKMAVNKDLGIFRFTPLNRSIGLYLTIYLLSTFFNIAGGSLAFKSGFFYFLKYFEYFLLYYMVSNSLENRKEIRTFIGILIFVAFLTSLYGWYDFASGATRVTTPFEGEGGEPSTMGGYLLFIIMLAMGLILNLSSFKIRLSLLGFLCVGIPAFLFTLSRGAWVGFVPAYIALILLSRKGKGILIVLGVLVVMLFQTLMPQAIHDRIAVTFEPMSERRVMGRRVDMDESVANRIDTWTDGLDVWAEKAFLGHGAGSSGPVVDNQYTRILIEVGILGFLAFLFIIFRIFRYALISLKELREDELASGLFAGYLAGLVGLLFHSLSAGTFILIRIMEPFWFTTAIVLTFKEVGTGSTGDQSPEKEALA